MANVLKLIFTRSGPKPLGPTGEFFRRRDEWRNHPMLSNQFRRALPGFGTGLAAFAVYCVGEFAYDNIFAPSHSHSSSVSSSSSSSSSH